MEYRQLGRSGLRVSTLSLGTMTFGGRGMFANVGTTDVKLATRQIDQCLDAGVNLIDTADVYSDGLAEEILGEALAGRRDRVLVSTKARFPIGPGPNDAGLSRHHLIAACDASLRRLRTDHIDVYFAHEWDGETPVEETLEALDTLVRAGKVRYVGCSNFSGWQTAKSLVTADRLGYQRYVTSQIHYSLQARDAEYELLPAAIDQGLGVLVWSPLAAGLLSGKFRRGHERPNGARQTSGWHEPPVRDQAQLDVVVEALVEIGHDHGVSAAPVALAWLLTRPGVASVVIGARTTEQLSDNLASASLELTDEELDRLERLSRPPLIYPYWHQAAAATDRLSDADRALLQPHIG
jgi:aryl-alcohol dehydrogenase-like predicted oxidoreductase